MRRRRRETRAALPAAAGSWVFRPGRPGRLAAVGIAAADSTTRSSGSASA